MANLCYFAICLLIANAVSSLQLPECDGLPEKRGITPEEKELVLRTHNQYREDVREGRVPGLPRAETMPMLSWDEKLAKEAQRWADHCPKIADGHPPESWKTFQYGQNIAWGQKNYADAMKMWFDEYKEYVENGIDPLIFRGESDQARNRLQLGQNGHFAQMVTALTTKIGCGKVEGPNLESLRIYICNYHPRGNWMIQMGSQTQAIPAYKALEVAPFTKTNESPRFRTMSGSPIRAKHVIEPQVLPPFIFDGNDNDDDASEHENGNEDQNANVESVDWLFSFESLEDQDPRERLTNPFGDSFNLNLVMPNSFGLESHFHPVNDPQSPESITESSFNPVNEFAEPVGKSFFQSLTNELRQYQQMILQKLKIHLNAQERSKSPRLRIKILRLRQKLHGLRRLLRKTVQLATNRPNEEEEPQRTRRRSQGLDETWGLGGPGDSDLKGRSMKAPPNIDERVPKAATPQSVNEGPRFRSATSKRVKTRYNEDLQPFRKSITLYD
ncbi:uncharacterized protein LOC131888794 isoform X2 [Tigriopus californicus]|uniref:uncharacterized protein LOC131888794 isoform X2 n=1 Tax=Tigriopus californicus TaxID=6832 RepID=UPI0027DA06FA|nr:uncharacterized protein LOC131888794 isoform X2 [Tigriopus californicus]